MILYLSDSEQFDLMKTPFATMVHASAYRGEIDLYIDTEQNKGADAYNGLPLWIKEKFTVIQSPSQLCIHPKELAKSFTETLETSEVITKKLTENA